EVSRGQGRPLTRGRTDPRGPKRPNRAGQKATESRGRRRESGRWRLRWRLPGGGAAQKVATSCKGGWNEPRKYARESATGEGGTGRKDSEKRAEKGKRNGSSAKKVQKYS